MQMVGQRTKRSDSMQTPKYIKTILKYVSFFAMISIAVVFILMAKDNSQTSQLAQSTNTSQPSGETTNSQIRIFSGDTDNYPLETQCASQDFFTSLPAKCMSSDGKLIQVYGAPSESIILPEGK
jgi:hypothetical protein